MFINKSLLIVFLTVLFVSAQTKQWRLIWDKNKESNISYYKVFRDTISSPANQIATVNHIPINGSDSVMIYTDSTLNIKGKYYYYRVKAVNDESLESDYSDEVHAAIPKITRFDFPVYLPQDTTVEIYLDNHVTDPSANSNLLTWETQVHGMFNNSVFRRNDSTFTSITVPQNWIGQDSLRFTVTNPDSFYDQEFLEINVRDSILSNIHITFFNNGAQARITWNSIMPVKGTIQYGLSQTYGQETDTEESFQKNHTRIIPALQANSTYYFRIVSEDQFTIRLQSKSFSFTTPHSVTEAEIQNVRVSLSGDGTDVDFTWNTSLPTLDYIEYGLDTAYGSQTPKENVFKTQHEYKLTNLNENRVYHFRIVSETEDALVTLLPDSTFTTASVGESYINVYPIPFELNRPEHKQGISFTNIPSESDIFIYNMLGELVFKKTNIPSGLYSWNVKNNAGRNLHTGLYMYVIKQADGKKISEGKIIIIY